jgi:hypothetical protein
MKERMGSQLVVRKKGSGYDGIAGLPFSLRYREMRWLRILCLACACYASCTRASSGLDGRVEMKVGDFQLIILNCKLATVLLPERLDETHEGKPVFRVRSCRGSEIVIRGSELEVNGGHHGALLAGDTVTVDSNRVFVNDAERVHRSRFSP